MNRRLLAAISNLENVRVNDLYELYPGFDIDVKREQALLVEHDVIVFQHPFYWYSCPALLKEWQDLVLEYGFAYGEGGDALEGKLAFSAITCGGSREAYSKGGHNHFEIAELLAPFEQTARLCGMRYLPPFAVHSSHEFSEPEEVDEHAERYRDALFGLRNETFDLDALAQQERIDDRLHREKGRGLP